MKPGTSAHTAFRLTSREVSLQSTMLWLLAVLTIAFIWFVLVNVLMMLWPEKLSIRRKLAPFGMLALLFCGSFLRSALWKIDVGDVWQSEA